MHSYLLKKILFPYNLLNISFGEVIESSDLLLIKISLNKIEGLSVLLVIGIVKGAIMSLPHYLIFWPPT
ncbi:MAG: hypothetical protein A2Z35_00920 [Actinobacteria bacterium RBG_19FT_COMBO_36_27]|nr:MAG: hypothetical protein A2Z35_00920 [Actinobacteria bacterium RBG_19FT_COMBO_36_27]